jgi:transposase
MVVFGSAISHSDRKSNQVDAEKLDHYARFDPKILRPIAHRTVAQMVREVQERS